MRGISTREISTRRISTRGISTGQTFGDREVIIERIIYKHARNVNSTRGISTRGISTHGINMCSAWLQNIRRLLERYRAVVSRLSFTTLPSSTELGNLEQ